MSQHILNYSTVTWCNKRFKHGTDTHIRRDYYLFLSDYERSLEDICQACLDAMPECLLQVSDNATDEVCEPATPKK